MLDRGGDDVSEHTGCGSILLVEDEPRLRQTLARSLAARDFQVVEATTVSEAIAAATDRRFNLVLLDVNLPDATGWDVLRALRRADREMPVVVMSAVPPNPARVREFRPYGILHKPFPIDALLRLIRSACAASNPNGRVEHDPTWHHAKA
jgi:two-component system, cell cycle sensor histidine kinase and response regulator CckA